MRVTPETKKRALIYVEKSGLSIDFLAKKIGTSYSTLWNFLKGETRNFGKIQELANELGISLYQLTTENYEDNVTRFAPVGEQAAVWQQAAVFPANLTKIPVYQTSPTGDGYLIAGAAAEHAPRIIGEGVNRIFAIKVKGDSMLPRYKWGEIIYCGYSIAPKPGDDCIAEFDNNIGHLKIYMGQKGSDYVFRQLNPDREWRRQIAEIKALHAVIGRG